MQVSFGRYSNSRKPGLNLPYGLYYLRHRFSADLDFFSPKYNLEEIDKLISGFRKYSRGKIKLESEFIRGKGAKVRFYSVHIKGSIRPLKIDFVEDVLFKKPTIRKIEGIRVYSVKNIYLQKIVDITGTHSEIGREITQGRREARDVFDIYTLSKNIRPLHLFLREIHRQLQRRMIHWYQTFPRQELKLAFLDLDIYDKKFDSRKAISYLENEIKEFIKEAIE